MGRKPRGSLTVLAELESARQAEYHAAGWQGRPGNPERHQERWQRARARVAALESELTTAVLRERGAV